MGLDALQKKVKERKIQFDQLLKSHDNLHTLSVREFRDNLSAVFDQVSNDGQIAVVTIHGRNKAAIISTDFLLKLLWIKEGK